MYASLPFAGANVQMNIQRPEKLEQSSFFLVFTPV
jgi:hypothetical protein